MRVLRVAEYCGGAAVFQQLGQLIGMQSGVERDNSTSGRNRPQVCCNPAGMVIRHNSQPRSAHKSVFADPSPDRLGHPAQFRIGAALELSVPLEFERDIVRPALRAFDEAVVESGHGSWGLYTKNLFTAERAEIGKGP